MSLENSKYSPSDLERIADDKGPFFDGMARQALKWAASVLEAADAAVNSERARAEEAEKKLAAAKQPNARIQGQAESGEAACSASPGMKS